MTTDYYFPSFYDPYDGNVSYNQINYNFAGVGYSSWFYEKANSTANHVYEAEKHLKEISGITNKSLKQFYTDIYVAPSDDNANYNYFNGKFSPNYGKRYAPFVMISERCCLFLGGGLDPNQTHACFSGPFTKYDPKSFGGINVDYHSNQPQDIKAFKIIKSQEIRLASSDSVTLCELDIKNSSFVPKKYPITILEESFFIEKNTLYEGNNRLFRLPIYLVGIDNLFSENFTMNVNMAEVRMTRKSYKEREVNEVFYLNSPWPSLKSGSYNHSLFYGLNSFLHKKYAAIGTDYGTVHDFVSNLNDLAFCSFRDSGNQGHLALLSSSCTSYSSDLYDSRGNRNKHYTKDLRERHVWNLELTKNRNFNMQSFDDEITKKFYERWKIYPQDLDEDLGEYRKHKNLEDTKGFPSTNNVAGEIRNAYPDATSRINFSSGSFKAFTKKDKDNIIEAYNNLDLYPEKPQFVNISPSG